MPSVRASTERRCHLPVFGELADFTQLPEGLPVPVDDGAADHLRGQPVPGLTLSSTDGESVRLRQLAGERTVIYVYPMSGRPGVALPPGWDEIPGARGCTTEACDFRDHYRELMDAGASAVYGLSSQDTAYQQEFVERLGLPFPILSDPELLLAQEPGLPTFEVEGQTLYKRITLVITGGLIEHAFYPIFPPNEHATEVLGWLQCSSESAS